MAVPIKKGVEFDCSMFDVRCKQECVSGGLRHTDKCPYDNYRGSAARRPYEEIGGVKFYDNPLVDGVTDTRVFITDASPKISKGYQGTYAKNSDGGDTLIMVTTEKSISQKGAKSMAKNTNTPAAPVAANNGSFQPTFRKYADMTQSEKDAFRQGAKTSENKVKERLGFIKPKN